ncbi:MAG: hypothetical protein NTU51_08805 [Bacteroidetes bacterium]|nr:hypothetical protein [Bacteroidota bacterium]
MRNIIFSVILALFATAFFEVANSQKPGGSPPVKKFKTKTSKTFVVLESHPQGQSLSDIIVKLEGVPGAEMKYKDTDPVNTLLMGDLDSDGYDELYITTTAAGSGSYGNIIGLASNEDKSISQIFVPTVEEKDMKTGANFEGYQGHDKFEISGNTLLRTFPVKSAKGSTRKITYVLKTGEAGYILDAKASGIY